MNYHRSIRRPVLRPVDVDNMSTLPEPVMRLALFRLSVALRARYAVGCEAPAISAAFEQLMRTLGHEVYEA